ncbi:MAG: hypothetical protein ACKPKO_52275, partial [Candidatus Fonsibacter sp.]
MGAALTSVFKPLVEPRLSPRQTAVRGGHCGLDITAAYRQLDNTGTGSAEFYGSAWDAFFGQAGPALRAYAGTFADSALSRDAAVMFAYQSKAFDRLSHTWMVAVFRRWRLIGWLLHGFLDQAVGRTVRTSG